LKAALTNRSDRIRERAANGIAVRRDVALLAMPEILALREDGGKLEPHIVLDRLTTTLPKDELWPIAVHYLHASRADVQSRALFVIGYYFQTNFPSAVPLVTPFLTHSNFSIRSRASNVIISLDPAAAAAHGVNTNRTDSFRLGR
jgi:hypothetical protein